MNKVRIEKIVENCSIEVKYFDLSNNIKGILIGKKFIIINNNIKKKKKRKRFVIAHELGHFIYGDNQDKNNKKNEKRADKFALDILVPNDKLIKLYNKGYSLKKLSNKFGIPKKILNKKINLLLKMKKGKM